MKDIGISRDDAVKLMEECLQGDSLRKHCYATEMVMRAMAERLGHDPEAWGSSGFCMTSTTRRQRITLPVMGSGLLKFLARRVSAAK